MRAKFLFVTALAYAALFLRSPFRAQWGDRSLAAVAVGGSSDALLIRLANAGMLTAFKSWLKEALALSTLDAHGQETVVLVLQILQRLPIASCLATVTSSKIGVHVKELKEGAVSTPLAKNRTVVDLAKDIYARWAAAAKAPAPPPAAAPAAAPTGLPKKADVSAGWVTARTDGGSAGSGAAPQAFLSLSSGAAAIAASAPITVDDDDDDDDDGPTDRSKKRKDKKDKKEKKEKKEKEGRPAKRSKLAESSGKSRARFYNLACESRYKLYAPG